MGDIQILLRDWIHETPLSLCDMGSDTCPDWELAIALSEAIREQDTPFAMPAWDRLLDITNNILLRNNMKHDKDISFHFTRKSADHAATKLMAERSRMRSSGATRHIYLVVGSNRFFRRWKVISR